MLMICFMNIVSNNNVKHKYLDTDITTCWFYFEDNKLKQLMVNNIVHILKANNHQFYNEIEYCLPC